MRSADLDRVRALERARKRAHKARRPGSVQTSGAAWQRRNLHKRAATQAQRRASARRPCLWVDREVVAGFYAMARLYRSAGLDCQVDHIVPLRSRVVCGLHVQDNLQIILTTENRAKGNRHWPCM